MRAVRIARVLAVAALAAASGACGGNGDDGGSVEEADDSGCLVGPVTVGGELGYEVEVVERPSPRGSCRFEPVEEAEHPGAHVLVLRRDLAGGEPGEDGYDAALAAVEAAAGPVERLDGGDVDGADRGWIAELGRVVQVGAAADQRLVQVTVADGDLDAAEARAVALALAELAL